MIKRIDPNDLKAYQMENLYSLHKNIAAKYNFIDRFKDLNNYKESFLSSFTGSVDELFILEKDSSASGILTFSKNADWNGKEQHKLTISLCDPVIDESSLDSINHLILDKLNQYNELSIVSYNNELEKLIKKYIYKVTLRGNYYTLRKEDIDINMLNRSLCEFETKNPDLSIRYTDTISEEYIEQYCDLFMETMEDMTDTKEDGYVPYVITPEKQRQINDSFRKRNVTHNCYMIFNSDNELIAKSNVSVNNNDPRFPYQFMIGVKRAYRGRSLGRWLYAAMYKKLYENVPFEKVLVCHHPENKHAINISEWVGYKFNYLETTYIIYK